MGRKAAVTAVLACLALALPPLAAAAPGGIGPPEQSTASGEAISQLYWFVFGICAVVFVAVEAALVLFVIRFRRRRTTAEEAEGPQIHGNTRLEIIWTLVPALILVAVAVVVLVRIPAVQATADGEEDVRVRVEAHQFYWQYVYPNGVVSLDRLVLPVDQLVELELTSFDVDHSWWVPDLTGKRDAIPGRTNTLRFRPDEEGTYEGKCAEFCGILHAVMPTDVEVVSASDYEAWLAEQEGQRSSEGLVALGRATWESVCADCHGPQGEGDIGPPIAGSGTLTDLQALRELLENGRNEPDVEGYMPPVGRGWPEFQLEALVAFVESDSNLAPGGGQDGS